MAAGRQRLGDDKTSPKARGAKDDHSFCLYVRSKAQPGEIVKFQICRPPDVHPHRKMNWQYNVHGNHEISLVAKDHLCITNDWSRQDGAGELKLAECSGSEDQKYNFVEAEGSDD